MRLYLKIKSGPTLPAILGFDCFSILKQERGLRLLQSKMRQYSLNDWLNGRTTHNPRPQPFMLGVLSRTKANRPAES